MLRYPVNPYFSQGKDSEITQLYIAIYIAISSGIPKISMLSGFLHIPEDQLKYVDLYKTTTAGLTEPCSNSSNFHLKAIVSELVADSHHGV